MTVESAGGKTSPKRFTRREIELAAYDVLRHHGLQSVPINPVILAQRAGIKVNNAKFSEDNLSGMIAKRGDLEIILVNSDDPPRRKRFTIAHELGHHFLHLKSGDGQFVDGEADLFREMPSDSNEPISEDRAREIQANAFAAALLMPEEHVRAVWAETGSIAEMADIFGVSEEAMGYRLTGLGIG